jgi:endoglucanase
MISGACLILWLLAIGSGQNDSHSITSHGGIVRMDTTDHSIYLVFTGHEFADGGKAIVETLRRQDVKGSFFFTGDFYRNPAFRELIVTLRDEGHYLGPHSDRHLLYASWENRDSLLVTHEEFLADLNGNIAAMKSLGIPGPAVTYFMPAYEWYNDSIATWSRQCGLTLVNFTPGTSSNADYTTPEMGSRYVCSDSIRTRILRFDRSSSCGLNGFILLSHIGTDPARGDKFYYRLDSLIDRLKQMGYRFRRLGEGQR